MSKKITVRKVGEQAGFDKTLYRGVYNKRCYVRQPDITGNYYWYTASKDWEPCCKISTDFEIEILKGKPNGRN